MIQLDRIEDSERIGLNKTDRLKECKVCHYNYFDNGFQYDSKICNRFDWGIKFFGNFAIIHVNDFSYRFFMFDMTEEDVIEFIRDFEPDDEFETMLQYERIDISEEIVIHKTNTSNEYIIGTLKMLDLNLNHIFVINAVLDVSFQNQKELKY